MPFIPHGPEQIKQMLATMGLSSERELFDEIPEQLLVDTIPNIPEGLSELEVSKLMRGKAAKDNGYDCYIGAGAYEHHIPAAVWEVASRGEFLTSYTPYQAECSQGTLQLLYEFQTMMASLTGLSVSNASLYDGATSVVEAVLMCMRHQRRKTQHTIWVPEGLSPLYRNVLDTLLDLPGLNLETIALSEGRMTIEQLEKVLAAGEAPPTALIISQPNFLGLIESADELTDWAKSKGIMVIGVVNPLSLGLLKPPGQWGKEGADIACGEAQPLGIPLASGGPYLGFLCATRALIRQMPGRIIGKTTDTNGKDAYCLTLQAREQHIRRDKATSNVCTNQGLLTVAATLYLALMGPSGLKEVAKNCHLNAQYLRRRLEEKGVSVLFSGGYFHEMVITLPVSSKRVLERLSEQHILGGLDLAPYYPSCGNAILVCVTETKTQADCQRYVEALLGAIAAEKEASSGIVSAEREASC